MDDARAAAARPRAMGRWPDVALVAAAAVMGANWVLLVFAWPDGDIPWAIGHLIVLLVDIVVRVRRPDLAVSAWISFSSLAAVVGELANTSLSGVLEYDASPKTIASVVAVVHLSAAVGGTLFIQALAVYPDDQRAIRWERYVLWLAWVLVPVPLVVMIAAEDIPIPFYVGDGTAIDNPFNVVPISIPPATVDAIVGAMPILLLGGVAILIAHYRRADASLRRQIRWLLVPFPFIAITVALGAVIGDSNQLLIWILFVVLNPAIPIAGAIGILQPYGWDPDRVLRRGLVYGTLWAVIVGSVVAAAAVAGTAAGRFVPIGWAVVIAIVVSLVFQPLRRRLEAWASRRVFGERVDHSGVITGLGDTLAQTFDLESLLPRMVAALEAGLQLEWAQVRLRGVPDGEGHREPEVVVPIDLDGEQLGVLECGPKIDGAWTDDDRAVVATFARQAALAVRNVRLTDTTLQHRRGLSLAHCQRFCVVFCGYESAR